MRNLRATAESVDDSFTCVRRLWVNFPGQILENEQLGCAVVMEMDGQVIDRLPQAQPLTDSSSFVSLTETQVSLRSC